MQLVLMLLVSHLVPPTAFVTQVSGDWLARERSHLSQEWSEYRHRKENNKIDFRTCREEATSERIAANLRAESVHKCVREHRKSELDSQH
jgi:hypothetical protein